jgi:hypothetical protein
MLAASAGILHFADLQLLLDPNTESYSGALEFDILLEDAA